MFMRLAYSMKHLSNLNPSLANQRRLSFWLGQCEKLLKAVMSLESTITIVDHKVDLERALCERFHVCQVCEQIVRIVDHNEHILVTQNNPTGGIKL